MHVFDWESHTETLSCDLELLKSFRLEMCKSLFRYGTVADWLAAVWPGALCKPGQKGEGGSGGGSLSRSSFILASCSTFWTMVTAYITI